MDYIHTPVRGLKCCPCRHPAEYAIKGIDTPEKEEKRKSADKEKAEAARRKRDEKTMKELAAKERESLL